MATSDLNDLEQPMTAAQFQRAQRIAHQEYREAEAASHTRGIEQWVQTLQGVLVRGLSRSARIDLARRKRRVTEPPLDLGGDARPVPAPQWSDFEPARRRWDLASLGGDGRHARRLAVANEKFAEAQVRASEDETARQARVKSLRASHAERLRASEASVLRHNQALDTWLEGLGRRRRECVEKYLVEVLASVPLPKEFPRSAEVTYSVDDEHAVVRFELPGTDLVPPVKGKKYIKTRDELQDIKRPAAECQGLYKDLIGQVALLVIRDLFDSDQRLMQVSFNGHLRRIHPATGQPDYPCLISLMVTREEFSSLVLTRVRPDDCLRHLKALISQHPYTVVGVQPIVDFDRSKYVFTQAVDVLADLDHRVDLMSLSPTEFEHLIRQVFEAHPNRQGWTTLPSKDDGIDAVIEDTTPITGGITLVQVKQYSKTVGVEHVRELMGAMEHKRAGRGVLVTTSAFTKGALALGAEYGGRMQLIDGANLVALMKDLLGKDVLIGQRAKKIPR